LPWKHLSFTIAEGLLASKLPKILFIVDSAGTGNWHVGKNPINVLYCTAKKNGLDISHQKARQFW
jgi:protein-tyrosine phosphatase